MVKRMESICTVLIYVEIFPVSNRKYYKIDAGTGLGYASKKFKGGGGSTRMTSDCLRGH